MVYLLSSQLLGQEDIESLSASIQLFANRLPQDALGVSPSFSLYSFRCQFFLGIIVSSICSSTPSTTIKNIFHHSKGHAQVYISYEHSGNIHYDTWC
jgi:hypothetical protein